MFPDRWFKATVYARIAPERVQLRVPGGKSLEEPPLIAIASEPKARRIVAFGREAARLRGRDGTLVLNPFDHPRLVVGDFVLAEQLLRGFSRQLQASSWFRPMPTVVIHAERAFEGGLTDLEARALQELAIGGLRASRAIVWQGPALTDEQLLRLDFPTTGDVLEDSARRRR